MNFRLLARTLTLSLVIAGLGFVAGSTARAEGDRVVDKIEFPKLNKLQVPEVDKRTLSNGLEVYILEDHALPTFNVSVRMKVGNYLESAEKIGLADVMADVMRTGGSQKWTGDELNEKLEAVGASVETTMGLTSGNAFGNSLIEYSDLTLGALADILQNPTFDQDKIDIFKTQFKGGISRRNDDAQQVASQIFNSSIYGAESPYARMAEYATVDAISRDDVVEFHKRFVHPANLQIAVWGDFKADDMFKSLESYFGSWDATGEKAPAPPQDVAPKDNRVRFAEKSDVNQSNVYVGHVGGKVQDEDYPARIVMNNIFGGGFGSRLFSNVRTREGLAYATGGSFGANVDYPGRFLGFVSTKSETTLKAVNSVIAQMESMKTTPPTEEEMSIAIDGYLNSFVFNFDTRAEVVNRMVQYDAYGLPQDFLAQTKERVEKVTPEDVQNAAKKHFDLDNLFISVVGKSEDFDGELTDLGLPIDTVDITIPSGEPESDFEVNEETIAKGKTIVDAAVAATGGAANYAKISSYSRSGKLTVDVGGGNMMTFVSKALFELPNKRLMTIQTPGGEMKDIFDGSQGWQAMGPNSQPMPETEIDKTRKDVARDLIVLFCTYQKSGLTPVYGRSGEENGASVDYVHFVDADGNDLVRLAVDAASHMPVAGHYFGSTAAGPGEIDAYYSDFREVSGIKAPFGIKAISNGATIMETATSEVVLNAEVSAGSFEKP